VLNLTVQTAKVVDQVEKTFQEGQYLTTRIAYAPQSHCCDVIATSKDKTKSIVAKIVENIDGASKDLLFELMLFGYFLRAQPILVGLCNRRHELEDNTIYLRMDGHIVALNLNTLTQIVKYENDPEKIAKRGGYMYQIDGEELRQLREARSISRKSLSGALDISTKTIAEYERRKIVNSQVKHVELLEKILDTELKRPISIFDLPKRTKEIKQNRPSPQKSNSEIAFEISDVLKELDIFQFWTSNSPFDVFLIVPGMETSIQIVSGIFSNIHQSDLIRLYKIAQIVKIRNKLGVVRAIVEDKDDASKCKKVGVIPIESKRLKHIKKPEEIAKILSKP
jgi:predicted transcriptional regulator